MNPVSLSRVKAGCKGGNSGAAQAESGPKREGKPMDHPYKSSPDRAFWKRAFAPGWDKAPFMDCAPLLRRGERVASAGSCFAANIVPYLERAGFNYVRRDIAPSILADVAAD